MRVKAIKQCFCEGGRRREGDVFETSLEKLPKWLEEVKAPITSGSVVPGVNPAPGQAPVAGESTPEVPAAGTPVEGADEIPDPNASASGMPTPSDQSFLE